MGGIFIFFWFLKIQGREIRNPKLKKSWQEKFEIGKTRFENLLKSQSWYK